jgi:DNA-binding NarL/FixJ family response regulator
MRVLTVLACVRTPDAARAVAVCADRLGVSASVRTAVTSVEALARLAERPADLVFVDGTLTRPDPIGFVRRAMAYGPRATLVVYGLPEPTVASSLISAGARGVIRGGDTDLVTAVTKTVLLLGLTESGVATNGAGRGADAGRTGARVESPVGGQAGAHASAAHASAAHASAAHTTAAHAASANGRRERPNIAVGPAADRTSHPLDTRNGGPGFAGNRGGLPLGTPVEVTPAAARGALAAVGATARGGAPLPTLVPQQRMDLAGAGGPRPPSLTERELQVLRGMADGKSNAEIGRELFVSEDTVKTHARRLFRKLGARDRAHAVASGFRTGLVG